MFCLYHTGGPLGMTLCMRLAVDSLSPSENNASSVACVARNAPSTYTFACVYPAMLENY